MRRKAEMKPLFDTEAVLTTMVVTLKLQQCIVLTLDEHLGYIPEMTLSKLLSALEATVRHAQVRPPIRRGSRRLHASVPCDALGLSLSLSLSLSVSLSLSLWRSCRCSMIYAGLVPNIHLLTNPWRLLPTLSGLQHEHGSSNNPLEVWFHVCDWRNKPNAESKR